MVTCPKCKGSCFENYLEDDRVVTDTCYHCQGTGIATEEDVRLHKLSHVAYKLAHQAESAYREACSEDPDGDDYGLIAAEKGFSSNDYFRIRVMERQDEQMGNLSQESRGTQELLIAWDELENADRARDVYLPSPKPKEKPIRTFRGSEIHMTGWDQPSLHEVFGDDDFPF